MSDHPSMPCRRGLLGMALAAAVAPRLAFAAQRMLRIGVLPYMPTDRLIATHQGLRRFFEMSLGRPAGLSLAPDMERFGQRLLAGEYDLVVCGALLGWKAHRAGVTVPIAISSRPVIFFVAVGKDSPIRSLADLRGKTVSIRPPGSFAATVFAEMLRARGLKAEVDVTLQYENVSYNSLMALARGEVDAAVYPSLGLPSLPAELLAGLRNVEVSRPSPSMMFSARRSADLPPPEVLQAALLRFAGETPEGAQYLRDLDLESLRAPDMPALQFLDRYLADGR